MDGTSEIEIQEQTTHKGATTYLHEMANLLDNDEAVTFLLGGRLFVLEPSDLATFKSEGEM